jgi:hypothetical protein
MVGRDPPPGETVMEGLWWALGGGSLLIAA